MSVKRKANTDDILLLIPGISHHIWYEKSNAQIGTILHKSEMDNRIFLKLD